MRRLSRDLEVLPLDFQSRKPSEQALTFKTVAHVVLKVMSNRSRHLTPAEIRIIKSHDRYSTEVKKRESDSLKFEPKVEGRSIRIENEKVIFYFIFYKNYLDSIIGSSLKMGPIKSFGKSL
jgi:hypothetical protein